MSRPLGLTTTPYRMRLRAGSAAVGLVAGLATVASLLLPATATAASRPVSFWTSAVPAHLGPTDARQIEVGVRFRSDVAGYVTGVRYYKPASMRTAVNTGSLWSGAGRRLATATFRPVAGPGWRTVTFSRPVPIAANTVYVASYQAPTGRYASDRTYFGRKTWRSGPLVASKGVYRYGPTGFPATVSGSSNYYADVLFVPAAPAAPSSAPPPTSPSPSPPQTAPVPIAPAAPPPTAAPSPSTAPSASPAPVPGGVTYGWQLTASNTGLAGVGVDRNSLPVFSGPVTAGMTISMKKITVGLDLTSVPNVTLDRVWLAPQGARRALILGSNTVIKDSDIDGSQMVQDERIAMYGAVSTTYSVERVRITGVSVGAWFDGSGSGTMTDTYIHNLISINSSHVDGFTRRGGTGTLTINRSRIDASGNSVTGAFFLQNTWGERIAGVTVKDTYLEGSGYLMTLENRGAGTSVGFDNVRTRSTGYGAITSTSGITYTAWNAVNTYDGSKLPSAAGAPVNR